MNFQCKPMVGFLAHFDEVSDSDIEEIEVAAGGEYTVDAIGNGYCTVGPFDSVDDACEFSSRVKDVLGGLQ